MENRTIKIVAVDDSQSNLSTLRALLLDVFPEALVSTALSVQEGFELAAAEAPDLIFLDMILAAQDGFEVCRKLKAEKTLCDIPVVFLTKDKTDRESRRKALESGAEGFLSKPIDESELTAKILAMIKIRNVKKEQALVNAIFNTMPSGVAIYKVLGDGSTGKDYIVQSFNHAALQMENKELTDVQGKSLFDLRPNIDNYGLIQMFQKVWKTGEPAYYPTKAYIDDQYYNWYENRIFKLSTGEIVAIYDDVTDKTLANNKLEESEKKYSSYIENAPNAVSIIDKRGRYLDVNKTASLMTGYTREELLNMNWRDLTPDESKNRASELFGILIEKGSVSGELQYIHKNGSRRWRSIDAVRLSEDMYLNFSSDITDRLQIRDALRNSEERFRIAQEMSPDGFTILHPVRSEAGKTIDFTWVYENKAIARMNQTDPKEVIGKRVLDIFPRHSGTSIFEAYKKAADTGEVQIIEEINVGEVISNPIWLRLVVVSMGQDIAILSQDITQRKTVESKLLHLSYHDQLTGLYNRRFFEEEIKRIDTDQNLPLSVIMCDVNGLKLVNDSFGHASGDMLLKRAAEAIRNACREKDVIARVGGDEFVVLLPGTTAKETLQIANQIKEHQSAESNANIELSISYGYDTKTTDKQSLIEILANAENHMYRHKLYERSSLRSKTIDLIMNTLFEKSSREAAHSSRVSNICHAIAIKMNLDEHTVNQVRIAGLIHDIGKIGIDEGILNKTGNLSLEERSDVERHPETGWRILSSTDEFSDLADFVLNHHEKWDGSGYPNQIKGEEIQLEARIIAIADAYDAMTSQRSYRNVLSKKDAIQELTRCSGMQFDPRIIDVFVNQVLPEQSDFQNIGWGAANFLIKDRSIK
jgi:diguanylate cyclase (GGDEF)-like protein/PAS domain S-box-containing protein